MAKHIRTVYRGKHLREDKNEKRPPENDYHYPLEKPIVDIYREINTDLWRETFGDDFFGFR